LKYTSQETFKTVSITVV